MRGKRARRPEYQSTCLLFILASFFVQVVFIAVMLYALDWWPW